jgi:hypothetical protein
MRFYAIAEQDCIDCFYDFALGTFGDGICKANLLPSRHLAEGLIGNGIVPEGVIIEVFVSAGDEGFQFEYENIWD